VGPGSVSLGLVFRRLIPAVCLIACLGAATASAAPKGQLRHDGRWLTDRTGRVVVLHGVNMVYKVGSYRPADSGFSADDARFLKQHGFNTVRLGVIYKALEPKPPKNGEPRYSKAYLDSIAKTQSLLAKYGIETMLDFHQDLYNERFQGEGWPDWQVLDDGLPSQPQQGFPNNYLVNVGLNRAFDNFWADDIVAGRPIQNAYAAAWRHVAKRFAHSRHVLGYDILNEPWPGSTFAGCVNPAGCPAFDTGPLHQFDRRVLEQIRKVDRNSLVFEEPLVLFNFGSQTSVPPSGDEQTGFSFHNYCLQQQAGAEACRPTEELVFDNADATAERTGDVPLLTEFSATTDRQTNLDLTQMADEHMVGWQIWHYCECSDPTTSGPGQQSIVLNAHKPPRGKNVNRDKLRLISRPYPQAVAGTPKHWNFDPQTNVFKLAYSTKAPGGHKLPRKRLTEIFLPRFQYRRICPPRVVVHGGEVISRASAPVVRIRRWRGAKSVRARVKPRTGACVAPGPVAQ
jgi:endoglycosylceramidase